VRWNDWKVSFAAIQGNIVQGVREIPNWPVIVNLRADPYEKAPHESGMYVRWYADNIWLFVPIQQKIQQFSATIPQYPFQEGSNLNVGNINYMTLKAAEVLKRLQYMETVPEPTD
jgi:arylsulfatase